jgi:hypothetical protein
VPVDRGRRHRQQFLAHHQPVPVDTLDELTVSFQPIELGAHRGCEVLPALAAQRGPDPLEHRRATANAGLGAPLSMPLVRVVVVVTIDRAAD